MRKPSAQDVNGSSQLSNLTSLARISQELKPRSKEGERVGESKLGDYFLRCRVEGMAELMVRNEERTIYISILNNCRYHR